MKILLAVDFSSSAEIVISEVARRPWPDGTVVHLLHVADSFSLIEGPGYFDTFIKKERNEARALGNSIAERLQSRGLETTTHIVEGYPATAIVDYARQLDADFIIVGSHGHSGVIRFFLGSVAHGVIRHAPCSVEIVRRRPDESEQYDPAMRILLATDGSGYSAAAARSIAARPWPEGSKVKVISVVHTVKPWIAIPEATARIESNILKQLEQGEEDVAGARKILEPAGLKVTSSVLKGYPKAMILDEASKWGADLIVVGSQGLRGITRMLIGSVSEAVAMHAHCSVEVIRDPLALQGD